jgi:uncharacterized protein (DUF58 family)
MPHRKQTLFDSAFLRRLEALHLLTRGMTGRAGSFRPSRHTLGDGLEFADHRAYQAGDDPRLVDWAYYARMEQLMVRLFHQHSAGNVAILLDTSASMRLETFDQARRTTAALAYLAVASGYPVRVHPMAERLGPGRRTGRDRQTLLPLLRMLENLATVGQSDLPGCCREWAADSRQVDTVFLLSDLFVAPISLTRSLRLLRARPQRQIVVVHLFSPRDEHPDLDGPVRLHDAETGQSLAVDIDAACRDRLGEAFTAHRRAIETRCGHEEGVYLAVRNDQPFERLVLAGLQRAGLVG